MKKTLDLFETATAAKVLRRKIKKKKWDERNGRKREISSDIISTNESTIFLIPRPRKSEFT